jgi:hypothetical protein
MSIPEETRPFGGALFAVYILITIAMTTDSVRRAIKHRRGLKAQTDEGGT